MPAESPQPFHAVLFDCDGVLVDSEAITNGVLRGMLRELGWHLSVEESLARFVGRILHDELDVIEAHTGYRPDDAWIAEFRRRRNLALSEALEPVEGAIAAVREIAAAYPGRVAVASGADRAKIELQLGKIGLLDAFGGHLYSGMETPRSKPAPDVYLAAAAGLGVDASACAVIEDTTVGVTAGVAAGATVFGFCPGDAAHQTPEALLTAGATATFSRMADLPGILAASLERVERLEPVPEPVER